MTAEMSAEIVAFFESRAKQQCLFVCTSPPRARFLENLKVQYSTQIDHDHGLQSKLLLSPQRQVFFCVQSWSQRTWWRRKGNRQRDQKQKKYQCIHQALYQKLLDLAIEVNFDYPPNKENESKLKQWNKIVRALPRGPLRSLWTNPQGSYEKFSGGWYRPPKCCNERSRWQWDAHWVYILDLDEKAFYSSDLKSTRFSWWPMHSIPRNWIALTEANSAPFCYGPSPPWVDVEIKNTITEAGYIVISCLALSDECMVYHAKKANEDYVIKIFHGMKYHRYNLGGINTGKQEIQFCQVPGKKPHTNLVEVTEITNWDHMDVLIMPKYDGNLKDLYSEISSFLLLDCLVQVAYGIKHMHDLGFVHFDVKLGNILVRRNSDGDLQAALCDFEGAQEIEQGEIVGSDCWYNDKYTPIKYTESLFPRCWIRMDIFTIDYRVLANNLKLFHDQPWEPIIRILENDATAIERMPQLGEAFNMLVSKFEESIECFGFEVATKLWVLIGEVQGTCRRGGVHTRNNGRKREKKVSRKTSPRSRESRRENGKGVLPLILTWRKPHQLFEELRGAPCINLHLLEQCETIHYTAFLILIANQSEAIYKRYTEWLWGVYRRVQRLGPRRSLNISRILCSYWLGVLWQIQCVLLVAQPDLSSPRLHHIFKHSV